MPADRDVSKSLYGAVKLIVRGLHDTVKARLQRRAARHGGSIEDEVRHILRDAVKEQNSDIANSVRELRGGLQKWVSLGSCRNCAVNNRSLRIEPTKAA